MAVSMLIYHISLPNEHAAVLASKQTTKKHYIISQWAHGIHSQALDHFLKCIEISLQWSTQETFTIMSHDECWFNTFIC